MRTPGSDNHPPLAASRPGADRPASPGPVAIPRAWPADLALADGSAAPSAETAFAAADFPPAARDPGPTPPVGPGPGPAPAPSIPDLIEGPGTLIGPYKLLQRIGEGGMGVVFMAEQERPIRRKVALKVIKPGMDSAQVIARFEAERQALALMDHPHIARVLDVGATAAGRPYFVMELVKGVPITEYCDRNHLTPRERLELFVPVCRAIQHAHQKGIIHRDIKPSNVMVTLHDGVPEPRVIDFGVAKAVEQRLTDRTMFTEFGALIGTLEYMSPEQAELGALDVDTRSDIYSLGVLLYELLTGSTPLDRTRLRQAAYSEILRRIREEEPARPSTRLGDSKDALPRISARRRTEPARLSRLIRGDLDWIVMKALDKDRTRRYDSATGFARDVRRYLDGDAVEATPPSTIYRLRKFSRKHRVVLATVGAFVGLLVAATGVSLGMAWRADRERGRADRARLEATRAELVAGEQRDRAVAAEARARSQQGRALEREAMAIDAVRRFADVVDENPELKHDPALAPLRKALLKEPQAFFEKLRDRLEAGHGTTPDSLARLALASFGLGQLDDTIGNKEDALRAFRETLALRERLAGDDPTNVGFVANLAEIHRHLGAVQDQTGRPAEAMLSYQKASSTYERLARDEPASAVFRGGLAACLGEIGRLHRQAGRLGEAGDSLDQARAIWERLVRDQPADPAAPGGLALCHVETARLRSQAGSPTEALAAYDQARPIQERLVVAAPRDTRLLADLATTYHETGGVQDDPGRALAAADQARAIWERLTRDHPTNTGFLAGQARTRHEIGHLQARLGRPVEALASFDQARAIRERLVRENPSSTPALAALADDHQSLGAFHAAAARPLEALAAHDQARLIRERLLRDDPTNVGFRRALGGTYLALGRLASTTGRPADAVAWSEQAAAIQDRLAGDNPASRPDHADLAQIRAEIAAGQLRLGRSAEALASFEQARAILERLVRAGSNDVADLAGLAEVQTALGGLLISRLNRTNEGLVALRQAREIRVGLLRDRPDAPGQREALARDLATSGLAAGSSAQAIAELGEAVAIQRSLIAERPADLGSRRGLAGMLDGLGVVLRRAGQFAAATAEHERAATLWEELDRACPTDSELELAFAANRVHLAGLAAKAGRRGAAADLAERARDLRARAEGNDPAEIARAARLAALLAGQAPRDNAERLELAEVAYRKQRHGSACRLFAEALAEDPRLRDDRRNRHAFNAACAAIPAAAGLGRDEPTPDDAARARLRAQGLAWLREELTMWGEVLDANPARERNTIILVMKHWLDDPDLASVRDAGDLGRLPEAARAGFEQLWVDVDQLLARAQSWPWPRPL